MIEEVNICGEIYEMSKDAKELYHMDTQHLTNCNIALEMMNDALECIYNIAKSLFPAAYIPSLYFVKSEDANAFAKTTSSVKGIILVTHGLIKDGMALIEERYRDDIFQKYGLLTSVEPKTVRSGIRVYLWRYIVLHELYHLWNRHTIWKSKYKFNESGELISKIADNDLAENDIIGERVEQSVSFGGLSKQKIQNNLTQQALELDADSSAVGMLVNLMMMDTDNKIRNGSLAKENKTVHIQTELALIMGALSAAFCLFDGNAGANFDELSNLKNYTHPLPSIRMVYAEEIANAGLYNYFNDFKEIRVLESEWQKLVCNVDADYNGKVDFRHVFYFPAYTRAGQEHLSMLKKRMIAIYDTLQPLALCNFAEKLSDKDTEVNESMILFDDKGNSLRGWKR